MRNVSEFPLKFTLRVPPPFGLQAEQTDFSLGASASVAVQVSFDPQYKTDLVSGSIKQKLIMYLILITHSLRRSDPQKVHTTTIHTKIQ